MQNQPSEIERVRAALVTLYPNKGFEQMDDEILRSAVVAAVASSPKTLTMEDAVEILERQAARGGRR
jgi:hypothetical protein